MARRGGGGSDGLVSVFMKPFGKGPVQGMDDRAAKFRNETIILVRQRWIRLTWTTVLSQTGAVPRPGGLAPLSWK